MTRVRPSIPRRRHEPRSWRCGQAPQTLKENAVLGFLLWCILFVLCWPLALLALLLWPLAWLLTLPFRLLGIAVEGVFGLLRALVMLPARVLGGR